MMSWKDFFSDGKRFLGVGLLTQAEEAFGRAYELEPNEIRIVEEQVNVQRRAGNISRALHFASNMTRKFPSEWKSYFLAGRCYFDLGEMNEAKYSFAKAREISPSEKTVIEFQSGVAKKMGLMDEALRFSHELIETNPDFWRGYFIAGRCYLDKGNAVQALEMFTRARELFHDSAELIEYQCVSSRKAKNFDLADKLAQELIAIKPKFWKSYFEAGQIKLAIGDFARAAEYFDRARAEAPSQFSLIEYQANARNKLAQVDEALRLSLEWVDAEPKVWRAYFLAGKYALDLNQVDQAQELFKRARKLAPQEVSLIEYQAGACRRAGAFVEALQFAEELIEAAPDHWRGYYLAARYLVDMSEPAAAGRYIELADQRRGREGNFDVLSLSSEISKRLGNREDAFAIARRMVSNEPSNARALYIAGTRALESNRVQEGLNLLNEANRCAPMFLEPVVAIINLKVQLKKLDEASADCEKLREIDELTYWRTRSKIQVLNSDYAGALTTYVSAYESLLNTDVLRSLVEIGIALSDKECLQKYGPKLLQATSEEEHNFYTLKLRPFLDNRDDNHASWHQFSNGSLDFTYSYLTPIEIEIARRKFNVYTMPDKVPGFNLYRHDEFSIYVMEGISHAVRLYTDYSIPDNSYFYVMIPHYVVKSDIQRQIEFFLHVTKNRFSVDRLVVMANSYEDLAIFHELGAKRSFFCNHNCWLDFNLFVQDETVEKVFDLVINTRPEKNMKRPYLAAGVQKLAVIRGALVRHNDYWPLEQLAPLYMNNNGRLKLEEVVGILNKSYCGGIFSEREGACYSSSEYLLCGLPVISTASYGGRDYWYNDENSIIVDTDVGSVAQAVETAVQRVKRGDWSSKAIRATHMRESLKLRDDFVHHLGEIFSECNINADPKVIFDANYRNQFKIVSAYPALKSVN